MVRNNLFVTHSKLIDIPNELSLASAVTIHVCDLCWFEGFFVYCLSIASKIGHIRHVGPSIVLKPSECARKPSSFVNYLFSFL